MVVAVLVAAASAPVGPAPVPAEQSRSRLTAALDRTIAARTFVLHEWLPGGRRFNYIYEGPRNYFYAMYGGGGGSAYEEWVMGKYLYRTAAAVFPGILRDGKLVVERPSSADINLATKRLRGKYVKQPLPKVGSFPPNRFPLISLIRNVVAHTGARVENRGGRFTFSWHEKSVDHPDVDDSGGVYVRDGLVFSAELRFPGASDEVVYTNVDQPLTLVPPSRSKLVATNPTTGCVTEIKYVCVA